MDLPTEAATAARGRADADVLGAQTVCSTGDGVGVRHTDYPACLLGFTVGGRVDYVVLCRRRASSQAQQQARVLSCLFLSNTFPTPVLLVFSPSPTPGSSLRCLQHRVSIAHGVARHVRQQPACRAVVAARNRTRLHQLHAGEDERVNDSPRGSDRLDAVYRTPQPEFAFDVNMRHTDPPPVRSPSPCPSPPPLPPTAPPSPRRTTVETVLDEKERLPLRHKSSVPLSFTLEFMPVSRQKAGYA